MRHLTALVPLRALLLAALAAFFGCTPLPSKYGQSAPLGASRGVGISYSLPMGIIRVQVVRVDLPASPVASTSRAPASTVPARKSGLTARRPASSEFLLAVQSAEPSLPEQISPDPIPPAKPGEPFVPVPEFRVGNVPLLAPPRSVRTLRLVGEPRLVPDPHQQFTMRYQASFLADDVASVKVSRHGLLDQIDFKSKDHPGDIVVKLVEVGNELPADFTTGQEVIEYDAEFDPCTDLERTNSELQRRFPQEKLKIVLERPQYAANEYGQAFVPVQSAARNTLASGASTHQFSGAAFRPMRPFTLSFLSGGKTIDRHVILLPNESRIYTYPVSRTALVEKVTKLDFDEGILTQVSVNKPSEASAFLGVPLALAKAVGSLPREILGRKTKQPIKRKDYEAVRAAHVEEAAKYAEAEQKYQTTLRQARQTRGTRPTNTPAAR